MEPEHEEYALLVIKPDGTEKRLLDKIIAIIKDKGFNIIKINTVHLNKTNVEELFTARYNSSFYRRYMTRSAVSAILVKGKSAYSRALALKNEIRFAYGVQNAMENIIHSPEAGNEFQYQLEFFFPELNIDYISLYADMYARITFPRDPRLMYEKLDNINYSTCCKPIFVIDNETFPFIIDALGEYYLASNVKNYIIGIQYNLRMLEQHIKIVGYFRGDTTSSIKKLDQHFYYTPKTLIDSIIGFGGIPIIGYCKHKLKLGFNTAEYVYDELGIKGVLIYHPQYHTSETEDLRECFARPGAIMAGGSGGIASIGKYSVPYETYLQVYQMLYDKAS